MTQAVDDTAPMRRTAKWLTVLGLVPMLGVLLFGAAGVLGLRAFSHNNSLSCGFDSPTIAGSGCSHYSYTPAVVLGITALVLVIGGGAFASYYAMRNVGVPLIAALRQRKA